MGRIMIVDPSIMDRKRIRNVLEAVGHSVLEVTCPEEALAAMRGLPRGSVRLIITELVFPHADGAEFVRTLKGTPALREIPIMVVSQRSPRELVVDLVTAGVSTIVTKPFGGEMLLRRVTETLSDITLLTQGEGQVLSWTIEDYLRRELKRAQRNESHFSLLIVRVRDSMEGQTTSLLMRALARHVRETDVLLRLGDDQVAVLLPDTDAFGASVVQGRIRTSASAALGESTSGVALAVDVGIGAATFPSEAGDGAALIALAQERCQEQAG